MGIENKIDINNFPKQYSVKESSTGGIGRKVEVCFNYQSDKIIEGVIIRDDCEVPYRKIIRLNDGRVILATECQYSTLDEIDKDVVKQFTFNNLTI